MSANRAIHANFIIEQKKKKSECIIFERKAEKGPLAAFCVSNCYETRNGKK